MKRLVWKDNEDVHFWRVCKSNTVFWADDVVDGTANVVLYIVFPLKCFWLLQILRDKHCTVRVLVFDEMMRLSFSNIVPNHNSDNNLWDNITNPNIADPVFCGIKKYQNHPSILKIKEMMGKKNLIFFLKFIDRKKLNSNKACQRNNIPVKIIKENINIITDLICNKFND